MESPPCLARFQNPASQGLPMHVQSNRSRRPGVATRSAAARNEVYAEQVRLLYANAPFKNLDLEG
jgi:hypothetical protein